MKMFNKSTLLLPSTVLIGLTVLAGCGGKSDDSSTPAPTSAARATSGDVTAPAAVTAPEPGAEKASEGRKSLPLAPNK